MSSSVFQAHGQESLVNFSNNKHTFEWESEQGLGSECCCGVVGISSMESKIKLQWISSFNWTLPNVHFMFSWQYWSTFNTKFPFRVFLKILIPDSRTYKRDLRDLSTRAFSEMFKKMMATILRCPKILFRKCFVFLLELFGVIWWSQNQE